MEQEQRDLRNLSCRRHGPLLMSDLTPPWTPLVQGKRQKPCLTSASHTLPSVWSPAIRGPDAVLLRPTVRGTQRAKLPLRQSKKQQESSQCEDTYGGAPE